MNHLIYIPTGLNSPEFEILLSVTQKEINSGKNVTVLLCRGGSNYACSKNILSIPKICTICKKKTEIGLKRINGTFKKILTPEIKIKKCKFKNKSHLLTMSYKKVAVGLGAFSSYTNMTRDKDLESKKSKKIILNLINTSVNLTDYFYNLKKSKKYSEFSLFNGRMNQYRPFFDIFKNLELNNYEFKGFKNKIYNFKNFFSQDLKNLSKLINKKWNEDKIKSPKSISLIKNHFQDKIDGAIALDSKSYTKSQKKTLPKNWNFDKKNIVYFTSSDDEYESYGKEHWLKNYKDHTDAVCSVIESMKNHQRIDLWIRIHPNLKNVKWSYVNKLKEFNQKYKNIKIINPESSVSSYEILKNADIVLGTSSTHTLLEATYWGKPSVSVGPSIWSMLGSSYNMNNHKTLIKLLLKKKIIPKKKSLAFKFIYFWTSGGFNLKFFSGNLDKGFLFKNKKIKLNLFFKLMYYLSKIYEKFLLKSF